MGSRHHFLKTPTNSPRSLLKAGILLSFSLFFIYHFSNSYFFTRYVRDQSFGGDEPKYLRMTDSIIHFGTLDLSNYFGPEGELAKTKQKNISSGLHRFADLYLIGIDNGIYCLHMPGLSFLLIPSYYFDFIHYPVNPKKGTMTLSFLPSKLQFTRIFLMIMALATILLLFRLLNTFFKSHTLSSILTLIFLFNSPFPSYAFMLYPAGLATFFSLLVLNAIFNPFKNRISNKISIIAGIGYLPWLHQRLIPLSLGLFITFIFFRYKKKLPLKEILIVSISLLILSLPYFYYFYSITGSPSPLSASQLFGKTHARLNILPLGFFGYLFSATRGFLWHYPWVLLFLFGIYLGLRTSRKSSLYLLMIFFPYYLMCSAAIPFELTDPIGRYLLPVFPILLIFCGIVLQNLFKHFSYIKLLFFFSYFALIFLNKKIGLIRYQFNFSYITSNDLILIIKSILIILFMFISLYLGEKYLWKEKSTYHVTGNLQSKGTGRNQ